MRKQHYYASRKRYWAGIEELGDESGLPSWAFDFISIHQNSLNDKYSLIAPLKICSLKTSRRRKFERRKFETFNEAKAFALRAAKKFGNGIFVVNCLEIKSPWSQAPTPKTMTDVKNILAQSC